MLARFLSFAKVGENHFVTTQQGKEKEREREREREMLIDRFALDRDTPAVGCDALQPGTT